MGASISRVQRAGGNVASARAQLQSEIDSGQLQDKGELALYHRDPEAFFQKYLGQTTKGKYHGVLGKIGHVVEQVAPIAALAIPGLGPIAAGAIAAGGSALGRAAQGKSVNVGGTLLKGAVTGAADYGLRKLTGRAPVSGSAASGTPESMSGIQGLFGDLNPVAAASGGLRGALSQAGNYALKHPGDVARFGLGTLGAVQGARQQGKADQLINRSLAPLNQPNPYADLNVGSYGNPYSQPAQMSGRQSLRRELMR